VARTVAARAVRSNGASPQAPAALCARSFHASAAVSAPKEMTVRDALNSALVGLPVLLVSPRFVRGCWQRSAPPPCDTRRCLYRMRSWGAIPLFTSWAKRLGTTRGERPRACAAAPSRSHRGLRVHHVLPVRTLTRPLASILSAYKITKGLVQKYGPERVIDTPITEAGFTGMAVGSGIRAPSARHF
jgi:hypothetical protein